MHALVVPEGYNHSLGPDIAAGVYASWAAELALKQHPEEPIVLEVNCRFFTHLPHWEGGRLHHLAEVPLALIHQLIAFLKIGSPTVFGPIFQSATINPGSNLASRCAVLRHLLYEVAPRKVVIVIGNVEVFKGCASEFHTMMTMLRNTCDSDVNDGGRPDFKIFVTHAAMPAEPFLVSQYFVDEYKQTETLGEVKSRSLWQRI
jgi:hypothetical protein